MAFSGSVCGRGGRVALRIAAWFVLLVSSFAGYQASSSLIESPLVRWLVHVTNVAVTLCLVRVLDSRTARPEDPNDDPSQPGH